MLRYHLDDLGAYQFEKLAQSLLKASIGLSVESWGNRGDWGRDAYAPHSLKFPNRKMTDAGPFVFQVKFVEGANAAGSRPMPALMSSIAKETDRILKRRSAGAWDAPLHFLLITNALVESESREKARVAFENAMPSAKVHIWGGDDVCDILDEHPKISRAFPQLLSIRDLDALINFALTKESRERSEAAVQIATELVPVFAPTSSYERAWKVIQKHHFVVLEGPPEVGKSAIAWMIGLTQAAQGWETIVCRTPDTFFHIMDRDRAQVFIADDAFGRTEYDPARTSKWEADLDLILHRLDPKHWLIWTSRKHILERACDRMDAQGKARSFPDPGSVLVDVSELSVEERALVLFRHAKSGDLQDVAKELVKQYAREIIWDPEFTPERMRRFIQESLPSLAAQVRSNNIKSPQVRLAIKEALRNPTKQMRITFQKLPAAYKWLLVAFLEISETEGTVNSFWDGNVSKLERLYETYCTVKDHEPFKVVLEHLTEAFVKVRKTSWGTTSVDWIHPSYRDLVIDQLVQDAELRDTFLRNATLEGVRLAVSDTGGEHGERRLPLLRSAESWDVLQRRCLSLIDRNTADRELLEILAAAASQSASPDQMRRLGRLVGTACRAIQQKWDKSPRIIPAADLEAFASAYGYAEPKPQIPRLDSTWQELDEHFRESLEQADPNDPAEFKYEPFDALTAFAHAVARFSPKFLEERGFPSRYESEIAEVLAIAESETDSGSGWEDPDVLRGIAGRMDSIASAVERLSDLSADHGPNAHDLSQRLKNRVSKLEQWAEDNEPKEVDKDDGAESYRSSEEAASFDIGMLFSEL